MRNSSLLKWAQNNKTNKQGSIKNKDEKGKKYNFPKMSNLTYFTIITQIKDIVKTINIYLLKEIKIGSTIQKH